MPVGPGRIDAAAAVVLLQHLRDVRVEPDHLRAALASSMRYKPVTKLPESMHIRELFLEPPETPRWPAKPTKQWFSWTNFFLGIDW